MGPEWGESQFKIPRLGFSIGHAGENPSGVRTAEAPRGHIPALHINIGIIGML